jgi:molybdenum cofactor cytidylyltransferase
MAERGDPNVGASPPTTPEATPAGGVAGVLLAAGASTRMGSNKLLVQLEGESLLRRAARIALEAGLDPLVVVLGHQADRCEEELCGLECRPVVNPDHALGQGSSLEAGLRALPAGTGAAVVLLADMPLVTPAMVRALVARWHATGAALILSDYDGVLAPPALYARALFDELSAGGEAPGKRVLARHRTEALTLPVPAAALADVDRPEDLGRLPLAPRSPP